jgi:LysM repeat protein
MRVWWRYHRVAPGETLSEIADKYGASVSAIREANDLSSEQVMADDRLIIPVAPGHSSEGDTTAFSKVATRYKVRRGDTILSVAEHFGVPAERLRSWNKIKGDSLIAGRTIRIHRPLKQASEGRPARVVRAKASADRGLQASKSGQILHKVKPGETLYTIANQYNTSVAALQHDNKTTSLIHPGDILVVRAADQSR